MLDANIVIYLLRGKIDKLRDRVQDRSPGELVMSAIAFAEVVVGVRDRDGMRQLLTLCEKVPVVTFDRAAAEIYAGLPFRRARFDRLIAAHALLLGLPLITNNPSDFADIPELVVENWTL